MTWYEKLQYNKSFLDTIDLEPYIKIEKDVGRLRNLLEGIFGPFAAGDKVLQGILFRFMNVNEFAQYLRDRYSLVVQSYQKTFYEIKD